MQGGEAARPEERVPGPEDDVQVAQAARALLDVRLQEADRAPVTRVTLAEVVPQRLQEPGGGPRAGEDESLQALDQPREQARAARDQPCLGHGRARMEVVASHRHALRHRPEAVADGEAGVPEKGQRALHQRPHVLPGPVGMEEQQVHVRERSQLAPAVAAEGHHRDLVLLRSESGRAFRRGQAAGAADDQVDEVAASGRDLAASAPEPMPDAEPLRLDLDEPAKGVGALTDALPRRDDARPAIRIRRGDVEGEVHDATVGQQGACLARRARASAPLTRSGDNDLPPIRRAPRRVAIRSRNRPFRLPLERRPQIRGFAFCAADGAQSRPTPSASATRLM